MYVRRARWLTDVVCKDVTRDNKTRTCSDRRGDVNPFHRFTTRRHATIKSERRSPTVIALLPPLHLALAAHSLPANDSRTQSGNTPTMMPIWQQQRRTAVHAVAYYRSADPRDAAADPVVVPMVAVVLSLASVRSSLCARARARNCLRCCSLRRSN